MRAALRFLAFVGLGVGAIITLELFWAALGPLFHAIPGFD